MNEYPHIHVDVDTEGIRKSVHDSLQGLDAALAGLQDHPFVKVRTGPYRREHDAGRSTGTEDQTHEILTALERGDITVDEAMDRLGNTS